MNHHSKVSISPNPVEIGKLLSFPRIKLSGSKLELTNWQAVQRWQDTIYRRFNGTRESVQE